ncbi:MAG: KpsF/GutQ family sugar-phosphate isomerase [Nitrospinota bacterium]|nr:KpsF/GutQ family sugar-phosphate isomerase [Nitrospinota bacterium]
MKPLKILTEKKRDALASAKRVLKIESESIAALAEKLDERFALVVNLLDQCKGHVIITGMGKSGLIGQKIAATFSSIGIPALFLHAAEGSHGDVGIISRGDIVIAISNSGETEEIIKILPYLNRVNATLISITGNLDSTLAQRSEYVLDVSVKEEACSTGLVPTASVAAALAMGDALAVAIIDKRGFNAEEFAQYHPGGSLGRKLLTTVNDLMHVGETIPKVFEDSQIYDVITEMSCKRLGTTVVTDKQDCLRGIITDGDLRRLFETKKEISTTVASEIMTINPQTIRQDSLAAKALSIMENFSITTLIVSGDGKKIEGIVHLHDLLKAGIV